ncbi:MAG: hypothetical protein COU29_03525 [Candidatus Magasanikbacteria bacterium CG10_big_fil_rev_8_21_14_0_10_36_32]|uniref:Uncharacterized protein n=1 Tax=Candidatus Magasanikbacteria bacterium CG10_big_fil_rev_8_21_14_0_10_36_32 TaxID=1974646 RepID=A0A2M6W5H6_9BACT|nr:MAG: hypothetical protein COU29_03525 [Candidatus Magasanikbacteria bacterium CG10_big_fil_rev_8_21_14_0_10_36_32]
MTIKPKFVVVSLLFCLLGVAAIFYFSYWFNLKQDRVLIGLADSHFPYPDYTTEELENLYPQNPNENVVTVQTPEQTHAKFITALKAGDITGAVECCVVREEWSRMKTRLLDINKNKKIGMMLADIETIEIEMILPTTAVYTYRITAQGQKFGNSMVFNKNSKGVWLIESF